MKDLAAILFVAVVLSAAIYMIWKENNDKYFDSKYDRATKPGRMFRKRNKTTSNTTKVVEDKHKPGHNNKTQ